MNNADATQLLQSIMIKDAELPEEAFERLGLQQAFALVGTALETAMRRRFPEGASRDELSDYAAQLRERFPSGRDNLRPIIVEGVLRAVMGEEKMLDGISTDDIFSISALTTYAITSELGFSEQQRDQFAEEVIRSVG